MKTALIVEDQKFLVYAWARTLRRHGWSVHTATSIARVDELLANNDNWQVILLDLEVDDGNTVCLIPRLGELQPAPAIAVVSDHLDAKTVIGDLHQCAMTIPKPTSATQIVELCETLRRRTRGVR